MSTDMDTTTETAAVALETWTYEIQEHDRCGNDWCAHMDMIVTRAPASDTAQMVADWAAEFAGRILHHWDWRVVVWRGDMRYEVCREPDAIVLGEDVLNALADKAAHRIRALTVADLTDEMIEQAIAWSTEPCPKCGDLILVGCGRHLAKHAVVTR